MSLALLAFAATIAASTPDEERDGKHEEPAEVITPDGGTVPTVVPQATDEVAPVLAPELKPPPGGEPVVAAPSLSVYQVDFPIEATITLGSFALFLVVDFLIKPTIEGDVSCRRPVGNGRCNPDDLTAFDRYAVGKSSGTWDDFSDAALFSSLIIPMVYLGLESLVLPTQTPWGDFANDLLIITEAMALTSAMQTVLKFAFRRPRPIRYTDLEQPLTPFDAELSFPSGHTSLVAAATTALTATVFLRHPESPMRFVVLGLGVALTGLTALARVESGNHFPTDVIIGGMVGSFAGFIVPYVHRKKLPVTPSASFNPLDGSSSLAITGAW